MSHTTEPGTASRPQGRFQESSGSTRRARPTWRPTAGQTPQNGSPGRNARPSDVPRPALRTSVCDGTRCRAGSPDSDGKTFAGGHALRLAAPGGDLAVLATFLAGDTCHVVIVRRPRCPAANESTGTFGRLFLDAENDEVASGLAGEARG